jgi:DNA-binding CsgD family transcriptional regulator
MSSEEIGDMLHISDRTVEWHITQAMKRLGAKNRVQAVVLAVQKGALTI